MPTPLHDPTRRPRQAVALLASLAVLAAAGFAADLLALAEESYPAVDTYHVATDGDGYLVAAYVPPWEHLSGAWSTRPGMAPDRVLLVDLADAERVAHGEEPLAPYRAWVNDGSASWKTGFGDVDFDAPAHRDCVSGDCPLLLVFERGDVTVPGPLREAPVGQWTHQPGGGVGGDGPVLFSARVVDAGLVARVPWWQGSILALALATAGAALAWGLAARRAQPRRAAPPLDPAAPAPTEDMLRLVRLSGLYVETISRYFLVSALVVALSGALVMYLALPPVLGALHAQVPARRDALPSALLVFAVPFAALVAALFWAIEYRRVRRELARWRDLARRFEEDAERILAA